VRARLSVARGRGRGTAALVTALALWVGPACGGTIVRLTTKGAYDEAITHAEAMRRPPRGRAARAFATALSERGRHEQARGVLLADFRHGGELRSLVALADLERALGLEGIAASHYARVADLSRESLGGRDEVCSLLRRRAAVWAAEGAGLAAERDLERAASLCGSPSDPAGAAELQRLRAAIDGSAQAEVDARVASSRCAPPCDDAGAHVRPEALADAQARARKQGLAALRRHAAHAGVELPAEDVVAILVADLQGKAGEPLLTDDETRGLVGEQRWSELAPAVMTEAPETASYVQLRLAAVMPDVPVTLRSRTGPGELDVWLARAVEADDAHGWRVLAWAGDLTAAELAISSRWRPNRAEASPAPADATPATASGRTAVPNASGAVPMVPVVEPAQPLEVGGVSPPEHWTARVVPTVESLPGLLMEARLRHAAGHDRRALEISRYVAARAVVEAVPDADARVAHEAAWHLAHGRPWQALALASVVPHPQSQRAAAAAATALRLIEAFCGGPCNDDGDRALVERTLGEGWVRERVAEQLATSQRRGRPAAPVDACPTLGELLAPDATGRLAQALAHVRREPGAPGQGQRLREAIEADLGMGCAGRYAVPLLRAGAHVPSADGLAEMLAHEATLDAPRALTVHAALAMVAGRERQASLLATAAGAVSREPARTWRDLARHAYATGHRELALRSLREALLHTPELDDPGLRRALVLVGLRGIDEGWSMREAPAGAAEPASFVADLVERAEPASRWATREALARGLAEQAWLDADARQRLAPALWPTPELEQAHAVGRAWVGLASDRPLELEPGDVGPLDLASQELLVVAGKRKELPAATVVFVEPARMEPLRLALATHSREWVLRWRMAVGLAVYGAPAARARALAVLLEMAPAGPRQALIELALEDLAVVEPSPAGLLEATMLATPEDQLGVVFSLPPDPLGL
jgi:hypothetical protein